MKRLPAISEPWRVPGRLPSDMRELALELEEWMLAANCLGRTELFFAPDESETRSERRRREARAKAVCQDCVVRGRCLDEALRSDERFGIWGGLTERERRAARRAHPAEVSASPQDIAGPGRLARLPAVVVQGRAMSTSRAEGAAFQER